MIFFNLRMKLKNRLSSVSISSWHAGKRFTISEQMKRETRSIKHLQEPV
jgi:hypothetical protein